MQGIELSKEFFNTFGREMLEEKYKEYFKYMAVGLVGEGSECFGYDDFISKDHDYTPDFCIWIPEDIYQKIGKSLETDYNNLPKEFKGFKRDITNGRRGILTIEGFYAKYIGMKREPVGNLDWLKLSMESLSTVSNGSVFLDNLGKFTEIRNKINSFYPLDVQRKKIAAQVTLMAQSGQYNYGRMLKRKDYYGAHMASCQFIHHGLSFVYLINNTYMPFYKWAFRGTEGFVNLTGVIKILKKLTQMSDIESGREKEGLMEEASIQVGEFLNRKGFSKTNNNFLETHGKDIMNNIEDVNLKGLPILLDF